MYKIGIHPVINPCGLLLDDWNKKLHPLKVIPLLPFPRLYHKLGCDIWLHSSQRLQLLTGTLEHSATTLKTLDTIGDCQRPVYSLGVSQQMHKITNLWKFELSWLCEVARYKWKKKTPLSHHGRTKLCAFRCLRSWNQIREKLFLSWKLRYFRGSCFSQCFILSTSPHYSLPSKFLC